MAGGFTKDGAVQDQIDATVEELECCHGVPYPPFAIPFYGPYEIHPDRGDKDKIIRSMVVDDTLSPCSQLSNLISIFKFNLSTSFDYDVIRDCIMSTFNFIQNPGK